MFSREIETAGEQDEQASSFLRRVETRSAEAFA